MTADTDDYVIEMQRNLGFMNWLEDQFGQAWLRIPTTQLFPLYDLWCAGSQAWVRLHDYGPGDAADEKWLRDNVYLRPADFQPWWED